MDWHKRVQEWTNSDIFDSDTVQTIRQMDEAELQKCFSSELEFGTGGLRGIMGAGTNRMNRYTVEKATKGLAEYLLSAYGRQTCLTRGVVIGYDTRNNSREYAQTAAAVLSSMNIRAYLYSAPRPTPQVSFSVQYRNALAGVMITASHNPIEYNGYKVYDEHGGQLVPKQAQAVTDMIGKVAGYSGSLLVCNEGLITAIDDTDAFVQAVLRQRRQKTPGSLRIVYTPLHGTGRVPVLVALQKAGFDDITAVSEQCTEDGNFPTVPLPNPEDSRALQKGIQLAENIQADIVLGTDPDSDRVGIAVRRPDGGYVCLTGNQTGALLVDYICRNTDLSTVQKPAVINTIVTSEFGANIARSYGVRIFSTLTGFKYIGEKITQFEAAANNGDSECSYSFLFGYEESYGYLAGAHARDKDAVVASLLICEMAAQMKANGTTLHERLDELYRRFGYYADALDSFTFSDTEKLHACMQELRMKGLASDESYQTADYLNAQGEGTLFGALPVSDVLKYTFDDRSWLAVRPSGTEPKLKIYYSARGEDRDTAQNRLSALRAFVSPRLLV